MASLLTVGNMLAVLQGDCGICFMTVTPDDQITVSCGHDFHGTCLKEYLDQTAPEMLLHAEKNMPHCPSCKAESEADRVLTSHEVCQACFICSAVACT